MWLLQGGIDPIAFPMLYEAMLDEIDEQNPRSDSVTKAVMTRLQSEFLLQNSEPATKGPIAKRQLRTLYEW